MSLVVAQATADGPRIVSDTYVTFRDKRKASFKTGTLKAISLRRDVAVCFAGEVGLGLARIREAAGHLGGGHDISGLLSILQRATADAPVEFIVATTQANSQVTRIRDNMIETGFELCWIGDHQAFERFQQIRLAENDPVSAELDARANLPESVRVMQRLKDAMQGVIEDHSVPTVGDFCISVAHRPNGFQYLSSFFVFSLRGVRVEASDELRIAEGEYNVCVVEPEEAGTPALGLLFPSARLGMLFLPLESDEAHVIHDVVANDYGRVVYERFGVRMARPLLFAS